MAKRSTGYTPTGRNKSNPVDKEPTPMKSPALKMNNMPNPMNGGPNKVASLPSARTVNQITPKGVTDKPGQRFPKLTKPAPMAPRTPKI